MLDCEFFDVSASDKAVFYADNGHSFDAVLLYGNEVAIQLNFFGPESSPKTEPMPFKKET